MDIRKYMITEAEKRFNCEYDNINKNSGFILFLNNLKYKNKYVKDYCIEYCNGFYDHTFTNSQLYYHVLNELDHVPKCKSCGSLCNFRSFDKGYFTLCSRNCGNFIYGKLS